jgi:hypothetical protein
MGLLVADDGRPGASPSDRREAGFRRVTSEKRIVDAAGLGSVEAQLIERLAAGEPPDRLVSWVAGELGLEPR